jgi:hypothetical protein
MILIEFAYIDIFHGTRTNEGPTELRRCACG